VGSAGQDRDVDRAALLGAALAAVVALAFAGDGQWDWLATLSGAALLAIVAAFFRLPEDGTGRHAELVAMAAVVGLAAALVVAAPLQAVLSATPAAGSCRAAGALAAAEVLAADPATARAAAAASGDTPDAVLAAAGADRERIAFGACIGALTSGLLWLPALLVGAATVLVGELRLRRRPG
jgi:hypothetical protein